VELKSVLKKIGRNPPLNAPLTGECYGIAADQRKSAYPTDAHQLCKDAYLS
jgi:hypothetical protein